MSNVLRSTTFQLEFNGNDGLTGIRTFSKAVRDADKVVDELSKTLGENATVTVKNVKTKNELAREARTLANQMARDEKQTELLTRQYQHMASMVGKTADEIEVLNAVYALGSTASKQQQETVANSVREYQRMRGEVDNAQGSLRGFRGAMQNAGWQVQDTIVQLQMGTSAFVVLSQQGSQFASAFGQSGAVVGAVIASAGVIGGALYTALNDSANAMSKLTEISKSLEKYLSINSDRVTELSGEYEKLAKFSKVAADEQLKLVRADAFKQQAESIRLVKSELNDFGNVIGTALNVVTLEDSYKSLGRLTNLTSTEFVSALKAVKEETSVTTIENYLKALADITPFTKSGAESLDELRKKLIDQIGVLSTSEQLLADTKNGWESLSKGATKSLDDLMDELAEFEKFDERQHKDRERRKAEAAKVAGGFVSKGMTESEVFGADIAKLTTLRKQNLISEELYNNAIVGLTIDRTNDLIKEEENLTKAQIAEYNKRETIRRQIEGAQFQVRRGNDPIDAENQLYAANMQALNLQLAQIGEDKLSERQRINALLESETERHNTVMAELESQSYQNQVASSGMAVTQLTNLANLMDTGVNDVQNRVKEMNDFQKTMFLASQAIAAAMAVIDGISLGIALAKNFGVYDPTTAAANAYVQFGTAIGVAQAGAIAGVTIAGAFDKGGYIPEGQVGAVAGFGAELVNGALVMGAASVTSREDTAKLLNGDKNVSLKIEVQNEIAGAAYTVDQLSEDRVRIIARQEFTRNIDEGVSNTLNNRNSKSAKSLRSNYRVGSVL